MKIEDLSRSFLAAIIALLNLKGRGTLDRSRAGIATWILALIIAVIVVIVLVFVLVVLVPAPPPPPLYP